MGVDIHVHVLKKNTDTELWDELLLYCRDDEGYHPVYVYDGYRNYELFDILAEEVPTNYLKKDLLGAGTETIREDTEVWGYYGACEITLMDLKSYLKKHKKIRDWDAEDEYYYENGETSEKKIMKKNPVKRFIQAIENYIELVDFLWDNEEQYKIIWYFDR